MTKSSLSEVLAPDSQYEMPDKEMRQDVEAMRSSLERIFQMSAVEGAGLDVGAYLAGDGAYRESQ